jgi:oligopeptide transport system permease protein
VVLAGHPAGLFRRGLWEGGNGMLRYVGRRLIIMFVTLFVIVSATWVMSKALPGTPFADDKLTPSTREVLFEKYGLDDPLPVQYVRYMVNVVQGDLGNSFYFENRPVTQVILEQAPISAFIGFQAIIFGLVPGLVLGVAGALRHNGLVDYVATVIAVLGVAVPSFVLGPLMQYWVGFKWSLLPIAWDPFNPAWTQSVMPSACLAVFVVAVVARYIRAEMLEDYVTLAKAKGLSRLAVVGKHVLRNSLIPLVTVLLPLMVGLVTGSLIVENIFAVPGIGDLFVRCIFVNDYAVILGTTIFFAVFFILAYLVQDILYAIIDPRIRVS